MKLYWLPIVLGFLVAASCGSPPLVPSAEQSPGGEFEAGDIDLAGADLELPEPLTTPLLSNLSPDVDVVEPGELVTFTADTDLSGQLTLKGPSGEAFETAFVEGKASLEISQGAMDGIYTAIVSNDIGALALGRVRITTGPGVWLSTDRRYVSTFDQALLRVSVHGIPLDTPAGLMVGDIEDEVTILIPTGDGLLVPSFSPIALGEMLDRPLFLPGLFAGPVSVVLDAESESDASIQSNTVQLDACDKQGAIHGDLGGKGFVRMVSFSGGITTATAWSQDGKFTIEVPPGQGAVSGWLQPDEGLSTQVGPIWVEVPCGQELEIALGTSPARINAIKANGLASLTITDADVPARPMPDAAVHQQSSVAAPLASARGGEPCRKIMVYSSVEGGDARGNAIDLAPELAAMLASSLSEAEVVTSVEIQQAFDYQDPGEDDQDRETRTGNADAYSRGDHTIVYGNKGFLSGGQNYIVLLYGLPKAATDAKVVEKAKFDTSGMDLQSDLLHAIGRAFNGLFGTFTQRMRDSAICGEVEPVEVDLNPGEATDPQLVYTLTNLAGEEVQGAEAAVKGAQIGKINPDKGQISGTEFTATYNAAKDPTQYDELLAFEATAGNLRTREGESTVAISVGGNYRMRTAVKIDSQNPLAFVMVDYSLQAASCESGRTGPFKGALRISGGTLLGIVDVSEQFEFALPEFGGPFQSGLEHLEIRTFYMPGSNDIPGTVLFTVDGHPLLIGVIEKIPPEDPCP